MLTADNSLRKLLLYAVILTCTTAAAQDCHAATQGKEIKNPYYQHSVWKLWGEDPQTVITLAGEKIQAVSAQDRLFPDDAPAGSDQFLTYRDKDWEGRKYAGMWDDVYMTLDRRHSFIRGHWHGINNSVVLAKSIITIRKNAGSIKQWDKLGVNLTSQSTTHMGHDIANTKHGVTYLEKFYYFFNVLRSGPAHLSLIDKSPYYIDDKFEALLPGMYNSVGSSTSEAVALTKMVIAGGYLPRDIKPLVKKHGLYPATLLQLWKSSLPYDVPYDNELRHRVAYASTGEPNDKLIRLTAFINLDFHRYEDTSHMRNMVAQAKNMSVAPPSAILDILSVTGGTSVYSLKSAALIHQDKTGPLQIKVSVGDSYDLQDLPISFRWKVLYGNKNTRIKREGNTNTWSITVPSNNALPIGRTSILLIANNGHQDSNPAVINIYKKEGRKNYRPTLSGLVDKTIHPGQSVRMQLKSFDPNGFPVTLYRWSDEVGDIDNQIFSWDCPADEPNGVKPIHIIASDGNASYNSTSANIEVKDTIARITASSTNGKAPLKVYLSGKESSDRNAGTLDYYWDFGDGTTASGQEAEHVFTAPGCYDATLTVQGVLGSDLEQVRICVDHSWPLAIDNGWNSEGIDPYVWERIGTTAELITAVSARDSSLAISFKTPKARERWKAGARDGIRSAYPLKPPFFLQVRYHSGSARWMEVLGHRVGVFPGLEKGIGFGHRDQSDPDNWVYTPIVLNKSKERSASQISLYVSEDTKNPGKYRFSGTIDTDNGRFPIASDSQDLYDDRLSITSTGGTYNLYEVKVWAPGGKAEKPDIDLSGNGFPMYYNNPPHVISSNGTDFGVARKKKKGITRSFTIHNRGNSELILKENYPHVLLRGHDASNFSISKAPVRIIAPGMSSNFEITLKPWKQMPEQADAVLSIPNNDPDRSALRIKLFGGMYPNFVEKIRKRAPTISVVGNGVVVQSVDHTASPQDHTDFGVVPIGKRVVHTFAIHNLGGKPLTLRGLDNLSSIEKPFSITRHPANEISPFASSHIEISFQPTESVISTSELVLKTNDSSRKVFKIFVTGSGR